MCTCAHGPCTCTRAHMCDVQVRTCHMSCTVSIQYVARSVFCCPRPRAREVCVTSCTIIIKKKKNDSKLSPETTLTRHVQATAPVGYTFSFYYREATAPMT